MSDPQRLPYGSWPSPISADRAAEASVVLSDVYVRIHWLSSYC